METLIILLFFKDLTLFRNGNQTERLANVMLFVMLNVMLELSSNIPVISPSGDTVI